jgi:hypothetical protein
MARKATGESGTDAHTLQMHQALVTLLLDRGADTEKVDEDGSTALMTTCMEGHDAMARLLVDRGADMEKINNDEETPLIIACKQVHFVGHDAVVRLLLQRGAQSIEEDEVNYAPAVNELLRQWNNLSQARKEAVRRYDDWQYVDMPNEWTVQQHARCPPHLRQLVAVAGVAWEDPLAAYNRKPGDLSHRLAEALYEHMGYRR